MNQEKYVMSAVLIIIVGIAIYLGIKKFMKEKDAVSINNGINKEQDDSLPQSNTDGKMLFLSNCASCHIVGKNATGPDLIAVEERGPWTDSAKLYKYIKEPESMKKN